MRAIPAGLRYFYGFGLMIQAVTGLVMSLVHGVNVVAPVIMFDTLLFTMFFGGLVIAAIAASDRERQQERAK